ncbi:MAG: PspC domain-containing protein [Acutalibacteraceae bacterium]
MTKKKLYKSPDKKICGVCAGIADYFNIDPTVVRILALAITFFSVGTAILIYFIFALALENPPANYYEIYHNTSKRVTKSADKKLSGVCGGIAEALGIDPVFIRLAWGILTAITGFFPGIIAYIVAACIMPKAPENGYQQYQNYQQQNPNPQNNQQGYQQSYRQNGPQQNGPQQGQQSYQQSGFAQQPGGEQGHGPQQNG